jgi:hypothetical protein
MGGSSSKKAGKEALRNGTKNPNLVDFKNPAMVGTDDSMQSTDDEDTFEDEPKTLAEIQAEKRAEAARKQKAVAAGNGKSKSDASKRQQAQRAAIAMAKSPVTVTVGTTKMGVSVARGGANAGASMAKGGANAGASMAKGGANATKKGAKSLRGNFAAERRGAGATPGIDNRKKVAGEPERAKHKNFGRMV